MNLENMMQMGSQSGYRLISSSRGGQSDRQPLSGLPVKASRSAAVICQVLSGVVFRLRVLSPNHWGV